jgi:ABC-type branched-subunit amino acid transport system substrate-binding protein
MSGDPSFRHGVTRRGFLTVAVSAIVAGVVAGVGAYYAGTLSAPAAITKEVTKTIERTTTATVTRTVTVTTATPTAPRAEKEVIIGQVVSLTGPAAGFGQGYAWGASKAVEDINKLGGVKVGERRIPVRLITYDDESDPTKTASLATQLVLVDNAIALLGSGPPTFNNPISVIAERYKTPFICAGPFEPWWASGPYNYAWNIGFRIGAPIPAGDPRAGKPGYTILDVFFGFTDKFADQTNRRVAVVACDDADGRGWYSIFGPALKAKRYEAYRVEENFGLYPPGTTDFSSLVLAWKEARCEILWGNLPGVDFGILWRQSVVLGWRPKMAIIGRAALFYEDISAWGGDLPLGIATEIWWDPSYPYPGIGGRTSASLAEEWVKEKGIFVNRIIGFGGYAYMQLLLDAIERAGKLDKEAINKAIAETNMTILTGPVKFTAEHDAPVPLVLGQWIKTDKPWVWECPVVFSPHPGIRPTHEPIFPLPPIKL